MKQEQVYSKARIKTYLYKTNTLKSVKINKIANTQTQEGRL